jgi:hypothetical protein
MAGLIGLRLDVEIERDLVAEDQLQEAARMQCRFSLASEKVDLRDAVL